jgi:NAD(P)-dependent dehydrogenase (short-subunit alcohol dehydrogenase family)
MTIKSISELFDLHGKAAVVTGAASGIGRAIALRLAQAGAEVTIADIDEAAGLEAAKEMRATGGKARAVRADVRSPTDAASACEAAAEKLGRLDILVNNAGIYPALPVLNLTEDVWESVMGINLKGALLFSQAAAQQMIKAGNGGKIINMVSLEALHPIVMHAHYSASKAGLVMLTKSMALELAPHKISVNAIAPGVIWTAGLDRQLRGFYEPAGMTADQLLQATVYPRVPAGRVGEPDDVAKVALFLASEAAGYMTGDVIVVDGGYLLT